MAGYTKHQKDAASGARVSYSTTEVNGKKYVQGTVTRGGQRWRFKGVTKGEVEERVSEKLTELANDGTAGISLTGEAKRDATKARLQLGDGETLAEVVRELAECRRLLGLTNADGKPTRGSMADLRDKVKMAVAEFAEARSGLGGRSSLADAVAFWVRHHPDGTAVTLGQLAADFLTEQTRRGNSPSHVRTLKQRMATLLETFGAERCVADFTQGELDEFIDRREGLSVRSRNSWMVTIKSAFKFAAEKYALATNPARLMKPGKVADTMPEFLGVEAAERILRAAEEVATNGKPWVAAATALLIFAGVRPGELTGQYRLKGDGGRGEVLGGLDWKHVHLQGDAFVRLTAETTKTSQARLVPISANLKAWLKRYGARTGRVVPNPTAWKNMRAEVEKIAGVTWGQDWARHSFATFHLALHGDRNALEAAMGHGQSSTVLEKHYRGLASPSEAKRFWAIMPTKRQTRKGKV